MELIALSGGVIHLKGPNFSSFITVESFKEDRMDFITQETNLTLKICMLCRFTLLCISVQEQ
jgi:hypothetical protein